MSTIATINQDIVQLRSQLDWFDEERRKSNKRLAELEQKTEFQAQEIQNRENRIKSLEQQLSDHKIKIEKLKQIEQRFPTFKNELTDLIDQSQDKVEAKIKEVDQLRRVEHEMRTRELAALSKDMPAISRLQSDMELRMAEETRLAHLIESFSNQITKLSNKVEPFTGEIGYVTEMGHRQNQKLTELESEIHSVGKQSVDYAPRIEIIADRNAHIEKDIHNLVGEQALVVKTIKEWTEQMQIGEHERNSKLNLWQQTLEEQKTEMEKYAQQWVTFTNQHKEAKSTLQQIEVWQKTQEEAIKESQEQIRIELNRLQSQWSDFRQDYEKRWKIFESDTQQRITSRQRRETGFSEELEAIKEKLETLRQDKEMLWRVQTAQADALKQWPRIWLEEVERTLEQNPYRRRQPTFSHIPDE